MDNDHDEKMTNKELVLKYQNSQDKTEKAKILSELYQQNEGLIGKAAGIYAAYEDIEDLKQEGFFGIVTAADRWRQDGGASFATYAYQWIRQSMRKYLDNCSGNIRISSALRNEIFRYQNFCKEFEMNQGRPPADDEARHLLSLEPVMLDRIRKAEKMLSVRMTSAVIGEDLSLIDTIADPADQIAAVEDRLQSEQLKGIMKEAVDSLDQKEREVIRMHYDAGMTLQEAADSLGMDLKDARRSEAKAFRKLRSPKLSCKLKPFIEEYADHYGYHASGLGSFLKNEASSVELAIIAADERERGER